MRSTAFANIEKFVVNTLQWTACCTGGACGDAVIWCARTAEHGGCFRRRLGLSTDWDKPTSATLGQMICNMDNVKNGLYNTGYYLIANFEGEAFSGYAGKPPSKLEVLLQEGPEYNPKFTTQGWEPKTRV